MFIFLSFQIIISNGEPEYCKPSNVSCWPNSLEILAFSSSLEGAFLTSNDSEYYSNIISANIMQISYPSFIIITKTASDIQKCVLFASLHNIQISIWSTGHSYSGRSSANQSLMINLSNMTNYRLNSDDDNPLNYTSITVETGLRWQNIYKIVNDANKIMVGGSSLDVGPGGYSLNGGHSPLTPSYGLSSDYVLSYFMIDYKGNISYISNDTNNQTITDLFWALRGSGGGTYGVIINITFQLHDTLEINQTFNTFECIYSMYDIIDKRKYVADSIINNYFDFIKSGNLSNKWGGYMFITSINLIEFIMTYPGYYDDAMNNILPLMNYMKTAQISCDIKKYNTYYDYAIKYGGNTTSVKRRYYFNNLIPENNLTNDYTNNLLKFINQSKETFKDKVPSFGTGWTFILIDGNIQTFDDNYSSINPSWRKSIFVADSGITWNDSYYDEEIKSFTNKWEGIFNEYGIGIYTNEENKDCDNCNWKKQFWSMDHYQRLLNIKQRWDPNQVFWCNHCVGSDQN